MTLSSPRPISTSAVSLGQLALFAQWTPEDLSQLVELSERKTYQAKQRIAQRGQASQYFYVVEHGSVKYELKTPAGHAKTIKVAKAGELIGAVFVLMGAMYPLDVVALERTEVVQIKKKHFYALLTQQPNLMIALLGLLSKRLYHILGDMDGGSSLSGTQRVVFYLLEGVTLKNQTLLRLEQPKSQIAAALNLTPEHFSRILQDLSSKGFIEVQGRRIMIKDIEGLCLYER